jgi:hypothetical protein
LSFTHHVSGLRLHKPLSCHFEPSASPFRILEALTQIFGAGDHLFVDWRGGNKPFTFNAALDPDVAAVACNIALSLAQRLRMIERCGGGENGSEEGAKESEPFMQGDKTFMDRAGPFTLWDVTCGSGTQVR